MLNSTNPWCVALFAAVLAGLLAASLPGRLAIARVLRRRADVEGLNAYEAAYLVGGPARAVYLALAVLVTRGCAVVRPRQRTVAAAGTLPPDAAPLEAAVHQALETVDDESRFGDALLPTLVSQAGEPLQDIERTLLERGLRVRKETSDRVTRWVVVSLLFYALFAGLFSLSGRGLDHPSRALLTLAGVAVAAALTLFSWRPALTAAGSAAAKGLAARGDDLALVRTLPPQPASGSGVAEAGEDPLAALRDTLLAPPLPGESEDDADQRGPAEGDPRPDAAGEFGYVAGGRAQSCSQDELMAMCAQGRTPRLVWTPASPALVHPAEVPWLFERLREARAARRAAPLRGSAIQAGLFLFLWGTGGFAIPSFWMVLLAAEAFALLPAWREWRKVKALTPADLRRPAPPVEVSAWALRVRTKKALYTPWICRALIPVAVVQLVVGVGNSVEAAGLVKEAVRHGQWWRLVTAPALHGNIFHFLGNYASLTLLGGLVERHGRRWHMPAVLVVSALGGSVASQLLSSVSSVGISGGIMGCLGYLLVVGWRYRRSVAPGFFRSMLYSAAIIGFVGLLGYGVIDNAAHAGGLVTGLLAGVVLIPRRGLDEMDEPERATPGGWAWASVFFAFCALAIGMMIVR